MSQAPRDVQEMAHAAWQEDLEAVARILARKPNLAHCLDGYSRSSGDKDLTILKMMLAAGAYINEFIHGETLLHIEVAAELDMSGSGRYGTTPNWDEVGRLIELGADPMLRNDSGLRILDIAEVWGDRASLETYLQSLGIKTE